MRHAVEMTSQRRAAISARRSSAASTLAAAVLIARDARTCAASMRASRGEAATACTSARRSGGRVPSASVASSPRVTLATQEVRRVDAPRLPEHGESPAGRGPRGS